jgi:hypothetical protein
VEAQQARLVKQDQQDTPDKQDILVYLVKRVLLVKLENVVSRDYRAFRV